MCAADCPVQSLANNFIDRDIDTRMGRTRWRASIGNRAGYILSIPLLLGIFQTYQDAAAVGGVILGIGFLVFLVNFLYSNYKPVER